MKLESEISDTLYDEMKNFIAANPKWNQDSLMSSSLTNFLFENGCEDEEVKKKFLKDLFKSSAHEG